MTVRFLRVLGVRSKQPTVIAFVDGIRVTWNRHGWTCDCDDWQTGTEADTCPHVDTVVALIDPRVLGEAA